MLILDHAYLSQENSPSLNDVKQGKDLAEVANCGKRLGKTSKIDLDHGFEIINLVVLR